MLSDYVFVAVTNQKSLVMTLLVTFLIKSVVHIFKKKDNWTYSFIFDWRKSLKLISEN